MAHVLGRGGYRCLTLFVCPEDVKARGGHGKGVWCAARASHHHVLVVYRDHMTSVRENRELFFAMMAPVFQRLSYIVCMKTRKNYQKKM